jgi:FlaA1/EpsC-like NDP-sugar epimerase
MRHSTGQVGLEEQLLRLRNRYLLLLDLFLIPLAGYFAFVLRLEDLHAGSFGTTAVIFSLTLMFSTTLSFALLGGYSHYWPFASLPELVLILRGAFIGTLISITSAFTLVPALGFPRPPRSIPFIAFLLLIFTLASPRFGLRLLYYELLHQRRMKGERPNRILIVGAGEAGYMVVQEIQRNPQLGLMPVGFVDDDLSKQHLRIRGVNVLGQIKDLPRLVRERRVKKVLIAIPSAGSGEMRRIVELCHKAGVEPLVFPGVYELLSGEVQVRRFRPVQVEDLLARDPVRTDISQVQAFLKGKRVLVTGAGGSIGSELCRQIALCEPAALSLLGHGENSIFHIFNELCRTYPDLRVDPVIVDVRDCERLLRVFDASDPEIVFHAAAHKHVPLMESNPEEAVTNNVGGTRNVLRATEKVECAHFVMISTDKAVNPTSTMGATKRVAELLVMEAARRTGRSFVAVRFGNVLGSRGSVVPLFQGQIETGGPLTVTHPEVQRYFMTIPEAVQLVLQAAALGAGGEIFVLDMGDPVKIVDLARDMIRLSGKEEIEIVFTGLRPGEKLFEELFLDDEAYRRTTHAKIFVSQNGKLSYAATVEQVERLLAAARAGEVAELYHLIHELVPECVPELGQECERVEAV